MSAPAFDTDASLRERRIIIRRYGGDVEMVEMAWGLQPRLGERRPCTVVRAEGRTFPSHRCLVPASEFCHRSKGTAYSFSLADGDWFYFAGIWRPATRDWPQAYAVLTIPANEDVSTVHDRQMAVLRRSRRMDWLEHACPDDEILRPLPAGSFSVTRLTEPSQQRAFAF